MNCLGRHILAEFNGCDPRLLDDPKVIESYMNEAARVSGATIVESVFHMFSPQGVSGVVVVAESHLAVHTWPEFGYAAVDYFSCGPVDCEAAIRLLRDRLKAEHVGTKVIERGRLASAGDGRYAVAVAPNGVEESASR